MSSAALSPLLRDQEGDWSRGGSRGRGALIWGSDEPGRSSVLDGRGGVTTYICFARMYTERGSMDMSTSAQ